MERLPFVVEPHRNKRVLHRQPETQFTRRGEVGVNSLLPGRTAEDQVIHVEAVSRVVWQANREGPVFARGSCVCVSV